MQSVCRQSLMVISERDKRNAILKDSIPPENMCSAVYHNIHSDKNKIIK